MSEQVICAHVEYHQDMYPEFAPGPIVVRCTDEAVVVWTDGGEPEWGEEAFEVVLCSAHAAKRLAHYAGGTVEFGMYSLTPDHRQLYLDGVRRAETMPLTEDQATAIVYTGIEEAGLLPAEEHADPWLLGYSYTLEWRAAAVVEQIG